MRPKPFFSVCKIYKNLRADLSFGSEKTPSPLFLYHSSRTSFSKLVSFFRAEMDFLRVFRIFEPSLATHLQTRQRCKTRAERFCTFLALGHNSVLAANFKP